MPDKSQRTEKATSKHRKEMREKGSVARSTELGGWAALFFVTSFLPSLASGSADRISGFMRYTSQAMSHPYLATAVDLLGNGLRTAAFAALPIVLVGSAIAIAIAFAQVGIRITPKALSFKFSHISPKAGITKIFSMQGIWTLVKTIAKLAVLVLLGYSIVDQLIKGVLSGQTLPLQQTLLAASASMVKMMRYIGFLALLLACVDYFFQRKNYQKDLRMTKQEIKDERRESDGSPEVKRELRVRARKISRMQMMAAVATADVVVTNPTHFAVAIAYGRNVDLAPRVVAKGSDFTALAIRDRAKSFGVTIVENPPLARTLHASCEVDDLVPPKLYAAVAQLLAFVYALSPTKKSYTTVHKMSS